MPLTVRPRIGHVGVVLSLIVIAGMPLHARTDDDGPAPADAARDDAAGPPAPLESRDAAAWVPPIGDEATPRRVVQVGTATSIQVNVNGLGNNSIGDAANEPSIAVDPTAPNRIAIGWRQFDTVTSSFRQAGYSHSTDGGRTWAAKDVLDPGIFRSDPVLAADADGTFYYLSLEVDGNDFFNDIYISNDGGDTWPTSFFAVGGDKAWIAIDTNGGAGNGNIYQVWNTAGNAYFPAQFSRSVNGGQTWLNPIEYDPTGSPPARPVFGITAVGPDGEVYAAGSNNSTNADTFWVVRSSDAATGLVPTFPQVVTVNMGGNLRIGLGPNPAGLMGQINVAVNRSNGPSRGDVYVLGSVDPPGPDPMDITFITSSNGGVNWSAPVTLNDDTGDDWQWFGTMSVAPNGRIDVVWNDHRNSGVDNIAELFHSSSSDGGLSWSPDSAVSPPFNSHLGWPQQNKLGDYYDMVSDNVGAHLAWAATFNNEQDVYYLRIGDYDCNVNSIGDETDLGNGTSFDCDGNGIPDECEIATGDLADLNGNGVPDSCEMAGDINGDGVIDVEDLLDLLGAWGACPPPCPPRCAEDTDGNCSVDVADLLTVLANWS